MCNLTPLDYFLWDYAKTLVKNNARSILELIIWVIGNVELQ